MRQAQVLERMKRNQISHDLRPALMSLRDAPKVQTCKMHLKHFNLSWENAFVLEVYNVVQARHGLWYCEDLAVHAL